jgi:hypothetical protein
VWRFERRTSYIGSLQVKLIMAFQIGCSSFNI